MLDPSKVEVWYSNNDGDGFYRRVQQCKDLKVGAICVPSSYVSDMDVFNVLKPAQTVCGLRTVVPIGFPGGISATSAKVAEIIECRKDLVSAVDVSLNIDWIKSMEWKFIREELITVHLNCSIDIRWVVEAAAISEYLLLRMVDILLEHDGDISTGTGQRGHTGVHHIELLRKHLDTNKSDMLIKAVGGIRSSTEAMRLLEAGADIVGINDLSILS